MLIIVGRDPPAAARGKHNNLTGDHLWRSRAKIYGTCSDRYERCNVKRGDPGHAPPPVRAEGIESLRSRVRGRPVLPRVIRQRNVPAG
ncbi:MAG: hypothetical protein K0S58_2435 [Nitrospira sp.]|nr:hypothetical protein [Nitrospira sp.]